MVRIVVLLCGSVVCQDIQQHECGEYALEQLQQGRSAAEVVDLLLEIYGEDDVSEGRSVSLLP